MRTSVSTIAQFAEWVEEVGEAFIDADGSYEAPWFRGHGSQHHKLIPGLYRTEEGRAAYADEELRCEFMRKALPLVAERAPRDDWEWDFLMQHFRAPTRLLDWTDSGLLALYFALTSYAPQKQSEHPVVWALNPWQLNRFYGEYGGVTVGSNKLAFYLPPVYKDNEDEIPRLPIAVDPNFTAQRMLVQHSHFTVHGSDQRSLEEMQAELNLGEAMFHLEIRFDVQELERWRWHLALLGITETSIFPDLEGLARELRFEYQIDRFRPKAN